MSDHLSLAPEMIDAMKRDLVDVISRYVEVDRDKIDVHFEHQDKALAMLANIPITGVNRGNGNGSNGNGHTERGETPAAPHGELAEPPNSAEAESAHHAQPVEARSNHGHAEPIEARPSNVEAPTRRRKRRKGAQHSVSAPQTGSPAPAT